MKMLALAKILGLTEYPCERENAELPLILDGYTIVEEQHFLKCIEDHDGSAIAARVSEENFNKIKGKYDINPPPLFLAPVSHVYIIKNNEPDDRIGKPHSTLLSTASKAVVYAIDHYPNWKYNHHLLGPVHCTDDHIKAMSTDLEKTGRISIYEDREIGPNYVEKDHRVFINIVKTPVL